ncbi:MAG: methyltransferase domain-containing protein [Candidatus Wildermuthbacteria bacterium]|nr:methyltransferase domain-containing protein [Candidatus Wildermuthbacteria bacterium]
MAKISVPKTDRAQGPTALLIPPMEEIAFEEQRILHTFALPFMWALIVWVMAKKTLFGVKPVTNTFWFDGVSPICRQIKEGAATWQALYLIYNHLFGVYGRVTDFWLSMRNAQAVRNRKKLVTSVLIYHLLGFPKDENVRILSLASGSAQSIVETLKTLKERGRKAEAVLVDIDHHALNHSAKLAQSHGVEKQITLVELDIRDLLRPERSLTGTFNVVEMVGWLEYDKDRRVENLLRRVRSLMAKDGVLITGTIDKNPERWFLHWVIDWKMIYRSKEALLKLLQKAGFIESDFAIVTEPQGIFHIAVCRKSL